MVPTAHMSTPRVYRVEPNRISGARYHRVALEERKDHFSKKIREYSKKSSKK